MRTAGVKTKWRRKQERRNAPPNVTESGVRDSGSAGVLRPGNDTTRARARDARASVTALGRPAAWLHSRVAGAAVDRRPPIATGSRSRAGATVTIALPAGSYGPRVIRASRWTGPARRRRDHPGRCDAPTMIAVDVARHDRVRLIQDRRWRRDENLRLHQHSRVITRAVVPAAAVVRSRGVRGRRVIRIPILDGGRRGHASGQQRDAAHDRNPQESEGAHDCRNA